MKNLTSPYGNIEYNYNQDSRLTGYLRGYANNDWRVNTCFDYDSVGKLTSITNIAQPTLNNLTDTTNKVKSIFNSFVYDSQGRLNSYKAQVDHSNLNVQNWQDSRYIAFNYNSRGQLTNETHKYGGDMPGNTTWSEMVYNYDTAGSGVNLTGIDRQLPGQTMVTAPTMTFDANNRIVDDVDGNYYFNSDTGNPTTYNGKTMTYDMEDRLVKVENNDEYNSTILKCGYYADGKRAWKCGASTGWEKTYYIYEGDLLLCEVKQPVFYYQFYNYLPAYVSAINLWGADGLAGRVEKVSAGTDADDLSLVNPITSLDNYAITWYAYDQQGTVAQRFNADGTLKNVYVCDAFGNTLAGVEEVYNYNAKYGYYYDSETGFYYCLQRYYDPANGRWLTEDPIGYEGGLNLYGYCGNSPVGSVDASGLETDANGFEVDPSPSFIESLIPIWGSVKAARHDFETGDYVFGTINTVLAISDIFLIKTAVTFSGKLLIKGGSMTWSAVRKRITEQGISEFKGQIFHHWLIPRNRWGKIIPNWFKNQSWNLIPIKGKWGWTGREFHNAIEGKGKYAMKFLGRLWYGSPTWFKFGIVNRLVAPIAANAEYEDFSLMWCNDSKRKSVTDSWLFSYSGDYYLDSISILDGE